MESSSRAERDEFRRKLREEWGLMWRERFDDRVRAEGVVVRDYPLLFTDRGSVIFASRDAKTPGFSEIVEVWASRGAVYCPEPSVGGWGKFVRTELKDVAHSRARALGEQQEAKVVRQQLKKGGKGWLHVR